MRLRGSKAALETRDMVLRQHAKYDSRIGILIRDVIFKTMRIVLKFVSWFKRIGRGK